MEIEIKREGGRECFNNFNKEKNQIFNYFNFDSLSHWRSGFLVEISKMMCAAYYVYIPIGISVYSLRLQSHLRIMFDVCERANKLLSR